MDSFLLAHFTPEELPVTAAIFAAGIALGMILGRTVIQGSAWWRTFARPRRDT
jgi:hypothetical protein